MKKLILITTLIVCVCAFAIMHTDDSDAEVVASGTCGTNLNWEYDDATTTLTISGTGTTMSDWYALSIVPWRNYRTNISEVVFDTPNLTNIGDYAFYTHQALTHTTLPERITKIGINVFSGCTLLADISLPDGIRNIDNSAFKDCTKLAITSLPSELTSIGTNSFNGCTVLALTSLPNGVTSIGDYAFLGCRALALTSLPSGLTQINYYAFNTCMSLAITSIPNGVTSIGGGAFSSCTSLTTISIPSTVTSIGGGAFSSCTGLQHIEWDVPNYSGTWTSGNFPFINCINIIDVTIGENVESLPNYLFYENSAVTSWTTIYWNAINCADFSQDNMIFHNDKIHTIIFGDNVKHVPAYLTREFNDTLESVSFNDGLESIGDGAFQNSAIVVLSLPSTVKSVGVWSFSNCPNVMIRTLPTNMESIGSNAFANCSGITEMLIPVGFSATISDGAFANDTNLKTVLNLSDLNIEKGATTYGSIGAYADEVRNDIPSIGIVQQKDHIVHETIEKTDMASTLLRILPALMVIAILSFIVGALYYRSRDLNE